MFSPRDSRPVRRGFTLVEVLVITFIIGVLAATVLPQFHAASAGAKEAALRQQLQTLRSQSQLYRFQHNDTFPASLDGLTVVTNSDGERVTDPTGQAGEFGPYLINGVPRNPLNGLSSVSVRPQPSHADNTTGWLYVPGSGEIRANVTGSDSDGVTYLAY